MVEWVGAGSGMRLTQCLRSSLPLPKCHQCQRWCSWEWWCCGGGAAGGASPCWIPADLSPLDYCLILDPSTHAATALAEAGRLGRGLLSGFTTASWHSGSHWGPRRRTGRGRSAMGKGGTPWWYMERVL